MANERLQGKEKIYSTNYFLEIFRSNVKMPLKNAPQKLNLHFTVSHTNTSVFNI